MKEGRDGNEVVLGTEHLDRLRELLSFHDYAKISRLKVSDFTKILLFHLKCGQSEPEEYVMSNRDMFRLLSLLIPADSAEEDQFEPAYINALQRFLAVVDDSVINNAKIKKCKKGLLLCWKYGEDRPDLLNPPYKPKISIDFIHLKDGRMSLEGWFHFCPHIMAPGSSVSLIINGQAHTAQYVPRIQTLSFLGESVLIQHGFKYELLLDNSVGSYAVTFAISDGTAEYPVSNVSFGKFAPLSNTYRSGYYAKDGWVLKCSADSIYLDFRKATLMDECKFLAELWRRNRVGERKAVFARIIYHICKKLKRKKIWVFTDKADRADDNAECLLTYILSQPEKDKNTKYYFALSKTSHDYARLKSKFNLVSYLSYRHKLLILLSDFTISGYIHEEIYNPFFSYNGPYRDLLQSVNYIFLEHGVKKDNLEASLNRYRKNMKLMVCSGIPEYQSILEGNYGYTSEQVFLTGLCRYDRLYDNSSDKKIITIMPTWRSYLTAGFVREESKFLMQKNFKQSNYYKFYIELLSSMRLKEKLAEHGYMLHFVPHPTMFPYAKEFCVGDHVKVWGTEVVHRDIYAMSKLLITDYSSVVFDFVRLHKPVFYCQFDLDEFYGMGGHRQVSYFDYERDGFGEVERTLDGTIDRIIDYMEHDCELKETYRERIDRFFPNFDQNNCQRVYRAIKALEEKR